MTINNNIYKLYNGDCLEVMDKLIKEGVKVDAIICDPPYGTTMCKWDEIVDFEKMWHRIGELIKNKNTPIVMFGAMPFTAKLVNSNLKGYKHHWIWKKNRGTGFQVAKYRPMMQTEDIITFTLRGDKVNYYPIMVKRDKPVKYSYSSKTEHCDGLSKQGGYIVDSKYPTNIIEVSKVSKPIHPTEKPTELLEYILKTYTKEGDLVLDFTMGSGSTGVACMNVGRKFIGIELDKNYFEISKNRIEDAAEKIEEVA
jgi:site-specific DNA-methyltransferase (adenine-specific)